jgi:hypothetical protein
MTFVRRRRSPVLGGPVLGQFGIGHFSWAELARALVPMSQGAHPPCRKVDLSAATQARRALVHRGVVRLGWAAGVRLRGLAVRACAGVHPRTSSLLSRARGHEPQAEAPSTVSSWPLCMRRRPRELHHGRRQHAGSRQAASPLYGAPLDQRGDSDRGTRLLPVSVALALVLPLKAWATGVRGSTSTVCRRCSRGQADRAA